MEVALLDVGFECETESALKVKMGITTNRAFKEWHEIFSNATCVLPLIDRLVHRCEIVAIEGESYRLKKTKVLTEQKSTARAGAQGKWKKT